MSRSPAPPIPSEPRLLTAVVTGLAVATVGGAVVWIGGAMLRSWHLGGLVGDLPTAVAQLVDLDGDDQRRLTLGMQVSKHAVSAAVYRENPVGYGLVREAVHGGSGVPVVLSDHGDLPRGRELTTTAGSLLAIDVPLPTNLAGRAGVLRVVRSLADVEALVADRRRTIGVGFAVIALLVGLLTNRARKPSRDFLRDLAQAMQDVTNERPKVRIEPVGGGELGVVSRHFNSMARALEGVRDENSRRATELEACVLDRTAELERANAALRTLDLAKDTFLTNISHELRTPLTSIVAASEILAMPGGEDEEMRGEFVQIVHHEARRLLGLVEQVIDAVQMEAAPIALTRTPTDLRSLASRARDGIVARASARNLQVLLREPSGPVPVDCDDVRLLAVLDGLLDNAVKFSPRDGTLEIDVRIVGTRAELRVLDEGPGVDGEDAERIFKPFVQTTKTLTDKPQGIGLGLPRARRLVEAHAGTLELEQVSGFGACLVLSLPLAMRPVASHRSKRPDDQHQGDRGYGADQPVARREHEHAAERTEHEPGPTPSRE